MELLGWRSVKDISGDGGVIKTITKEGSEWQKPNDRDEVLGAYRRVCYANMPRLLACVCDSCGAAVHAALRCLCDGVSGAAQAGACSASAQVWACDSACLLA